MEETDKQQGKTEKIGMNVKALSSLQMIRKKRDYNKGSNELNKWVLEFNVSVN